MILAVQVSFALDLVMENAVVENLVPLRPIERVRASREVAEQIKRLILAGEIPPGARLPSERELVKQLNVGRAVVREALRILEVMGFADTRQGRGTFVTSAPVASEGAPQLARRALQEVAIQEVYEARLGIEPYLAGLAAERRTEGDARALAANVESFKARVTSGEIDEMVLADLDFHRRLGEMARNSVLRRALELVLDPAHHLSWITLRLPGRSPRSIAQHERILDCVTAGDADGSRRAMFDHLTSAATALREAAGAEGAGTDDRDPAARSGQAR